MKRTILLALSFALALPVVAQTPAPTNPPDKPKTSELQDTQLELYISKATEIQTKYQSAMQQESAPWIAKANAKIEEIQKANPGWTWHTAQSPQDHTGWVRTPTPAATSTLPVPVAMPKK